MLHRPEREGQMSLTGSPCKTRRGAQGCARKRDTAVVLLGLDYGKSVKERSVVCANKNDGKSPQGMLASLNMCCLLLQLQHDYRIPGNLGLSHSMRNKTLSS